MTRYSLQVGACAAVLLFAGTACGSDDAGESTAGASQTSSTTATTGAAASGPTVTIKLIAFSPTDVRIAAGGTVTWRQDDVATHTVTSGRVEQAGGTATAKPDGRFDSGSISKGQDFTFSFTQAGEYPFYCAIHPATMTGIVTVA